MILAKRHTYFGIKIMPSKKQIAYWERMKGGKPACLVTHGMTGTRFYTIWYNMKSRCKNIDDPAYKYYGGRGIKCLWNSFEEFRDDMYESYNSHIEKFCEKNTTIDRINNAENYCKENCKWATMKEQANNKRNNIFYEFNGEKHTIREWAKIKNIKIPALVSRIYRNHWSMEKALTVPIRYVKCI